MKYRIETDRCACLRICDTVEEARAKIKDFVENDRYHGYDSVNDYRIVDEEGVVVE